MLLRWLSISELIFWMIVFAGVTVCAKTAQDLGLVRFDDEGNKGEYQ